MKRFLVIAHRGASGQLPENTLPAFQRAVELGADMIETDLHGTRDGVIALTHDAIGDASLAELRERHPELPTLDEALDAFGPRIGWNLEIKCGESGAYPGLERLAYQAAERRGLLEATLFSCFEDEVLARLRAHAPRARIALLLSARRPERALDRARALGAEALNPWRGLVDAALVDGAHRAGLAVYPYTVDEGDEMQRLMALGVDGLFTNFPERALALRDSPGGDRAGGRRNP